MNTILSISFTFFAENPSAYTQQVKIKHSLSTTAVYSSVKEDCMPVLKASRMYQVPETTLGRDARKPVFGVFDKASLKQVSSATETS